MSSMPSEAAVRAQLRGTDDVLLGEVARELGISRTTAWVRAKCGAIPAEWRGGRYLVKRRVLARLVEAERRTASSTAETPVSKDASA